MSKKTDPGIRQHVKDALSNKFQAVKNMRAISKDTGYSRPKHFNYDTTKPGLIIIDCYGDEKLKAKMLVALDSGIELGMRMSRVDKKRK